MTDLRQNGFFGGEIGPQLWGRTDVKQYASGLAYARNCYITRFSGIQNRPGTTSCGTTHGSTYPSRMEPFAINATNAFMLEFCADGTCTPWLDGAQINISSVATAWNSGTAYTRGSIVLYGGLYYWAWLQNTNQVPPIGGSIYWFQLNGQILSFPLGASSQPGITGQSVFDMQCVQQNDVMICVCQTALPFTINYFSNTLWTIETVTQSATGATATIGAPTLTIASSGPQSYNYVITYIDSVTGMESLPSAPANSGPADLDATHPITITPTAAIPGALIYNIYRQTNGIYGFIGQTTFGDALSDVAIVADISDQPPASIPLFQTANDYPGAVGAYQGRILFGNTVNNPQTFWASRIGPFLQFTVSTPVVDSDAIEATMNGRQRQAIQAFVDIGKLIIHTSHGEYVANGNAYGALTPTGLNILQQGYCGSQFLTPVQIGNTDIFVQARGNMIRDLRYEVQSFAYTGKDDTVFSPHLFTADTIVQMAWQQVFDSLVWVAMGSGALLSMTYLKEQDMWGWTHHDTVGGYFASVCSVHEGNQDATYVCVNRPTVSNGIVTNSYWIERFAQREFANLATEAIFTDASFLYDGRNANLGNTVATSTLSGGWTPTDVVEIVISGTTWPTTVVGNTVVLQELNPFTGALEDQVNFTVQARLNATTITCQPQRNVPSWAQGVTGFGTWGLAVNTFTLPTPNPLIGQTVTGLGDGFVITPQVVPSSGIIVTSTNFLVVSLGLPVTCDIQTLPLENAAGATIAAKQVRVNEITPLFYGTIGGEYGQDEDALYPLPWPTPTLDEPGAAQNGALRLPIAGEWDPAGQVWIRQAQPLPLGLTGIVITCSVGN